MEKEPIVDGFSSQEEFKEEEIYVHGERTNETVPNAKQEIRFRVEPPPQIKDKPYPLHPDITSGWVPRILLPNPVPTTYQNYIVDALVRELLRPRQQSPYRIAYLGPRYENSYFIHYGKSYHFPYSHIRPPERIRFTNRSFLGNNPDCCDGLGFDSLFQAGNLDCAVKVGASEYDLFLQVDSNTKGHLQWYNFKVSKTRKNARCRFNLCNFQKCKSLYTRGMKPFVMSRKRNEQLHTGWEQAGDNLRYDLKPLRFRALLDSDTDRYYRLTFDYTFEYDDDEVQFAYCVPYDYTTLMKWIEQLSLRCADAGFLKVSKLCCSLGALEVPLLTIHQPDQLAEEQKTIQNSKPTTASQEDLRNESTWNYPSARKCIVISGRAHPGESNGSFMMQGFLQFLCGQSAAAVYLRKRVVFKIVPMLNPDGVVSGNYRTGLSGKDFNREFLNPDRFIFPEISALKDLVVKCKREYKNNLLLFLDFHGHSIKKNVFMYGPEFPITERYYYESKILPKLLGRRTEMFRYYSCIFRISTFKETTARAILLRKLDIPFSYTIEASNGSYYDKQEMKDQQFTPRLWIQMGQEIGKTVEEYCQALIASEEQRAEKQKERAFNHKKKKSWVETRRVSKFSASTPSRSVSKRSNPCEKPARREPTVDVSEGILKEIVDEIKQAERQEEKDKEVMSDDAMSEGSSDQEKEADDLSPDKYRKLCKIIACKKFQGLQKCNLNSKEGAESPSPTRHRPIRQMSSKSNPQDSEEMLLCSAVTVHDSTSNLANIVLNNNSEEELSPQLEEPEAQLPPITQVFTNRGRMSVKQKHQNTRRQMNETMRDTVKTRATAKVSNISFFNPFWQDEHRLSNIPGNRQRAESGPPGQLTHVVDSLRRTYNIYRQNNTMTYSKQLALSSLNRSLFKHHQFKTKLKHDRKSVNYSLMYAQR